MVNLYGVLEEQGVRVKERKDAQWIEEEEEGEGGRVCSPCVSLLKFWQVYSWVWTHLGILALAWRMDTHGIQPSASMQRGKKKKIQLST